MKMTYEWLAYTGAEEDQVRKMLYRHAVEARMRARSYRDFRVGAALIAWSHESSSWEVFRGMNTKVSKNARPVCAEAIAIAAAEAAGVMQINDIVIVGNPREEDETRTLHPCDECRQFMWHSKLIHRETRIITALPPPQSSAYETHTMEKLLKRHGDVPYFRRLE